MISFIIYDGAGLEKSAGMVRRFYGRIALIFLDLLFRFVSRQNESVRL